MFTFTYWESLSLFILLPNNKCGHFYYYGFVAILFQSLPCVLLLPQFIIIYKERKFVFEKEVRYFFLARDDLLYLFVVLFFFCLSIVRVFINWDLSLIRLLKSRNRFRSQALRLIPHYYFKRINWNWKATPGMAIRSSAGLFHCFIFILKLIMSLVKKHATSFIVKKIIDDESVKICTERVSNKDGGS